MRAFAVKREDAQHNLFWLEAIDKERCILVWTTDKSRAAFFNEAWARRIVDTAAAETTDLVRLDFLGRVEGGQHG